MNSNVDHKLLFSHIDSLIDTMTTTSRTPDRDRDQKKAELLNKVKKDGIEYIRFESCNMQGSSFGKIIPTRHLKTFLDTGFGQFLGSWFFSVDYHITPDTAADGYGNATCFPFYDTYSVVPWVKSAKVARLIFYPTFKGKRISVDPRSACMLQLQKLKNIGFECYSSFEHEFQMINKETKKPLWSGIEVFNHNKLTEHEDFVYDCERHLYKMGIDLETMHIEYGPGAYEFTMIPAFGIRAADNSFTYRNAIKQMAMKRGWLASFATVPFPNDTGCFNGTHLNMSLWSVTDDGDDDSKQDMVGQAKTNVFYDGNDKRGLSNICYWFMGGILKHFEALTVFSNGTQNSFRRTNAKRFCPFNATWGIDNRLVCIRVKPSKDNTYIEFRLPGASCCAYLVLASVIAAGIDGIRNKIDCGENAVDPSAKEFENVAVAPKDMVTAIGHLRKDTVLCKALGPDLVKYYCNSKEMECGALAAMSEKTSQVQAEKDMFWDI